jgi:enoyl-CoA hydratase
MPDMSYVQTELADGVATITLSDPDRRNALNADLVTELVDTIDQLEKSDAAVMVITGAPPAFCAGADLSSLENADGPALRQIYQGFTKVHRTPIPSIAAVNGPTVGAGMNLALACDLRLAGESARFDTGFLKLEIHPGGGHTWMLQREIGVQATFALTLFGDTLTGAEAEARGLVWKCVPDDELMPLAQRMAAHAAKHPPTLVRHLNDTIQEMVSTPTYAEAVETEFERQMWSVHQPEFKAAIAKMRESISTKKGDAEAPPADQ